MMRWLWLFGAVLVTTTTAAGQAGRRSTRRSRTMTSDSRARW